MIGLYLVFGFIQLHSTHCLIKSWRQDSQRIDWQPVGYNTECAQHSLVYQPKGSVESGIPTGQAAISRIVLPEYGAIVIQDTSPIVLREEEPGSKRCSSGWQNYLKQSAEPPKSWYDPDMWSIVEPEQLNAARPHVDRIPCECDTASIVTNRSLSFEMNGMEEIAVHSLHVNGQSGSLQQLIGSELGTMMLMGLGDDAKVVDAQCSPQSSQCGCHSPTHFHRVQEAVCANVRCPIAACESPVRPLGHCCDICGAVLQTKVTASECKDSPNTQVEHQMLGALRGQPESRLMSQVEMYENVYPNLDSGPINRFILQLVLVDRGSVYEEHSSQLALIIAAKFPDFTSVQRSGRAHNPGSASSVWTLCLGTLLFVGMIFFAVYAHYEKQWLGLPALPTSRFERLINTRMTVARYDNVSMAEGFANIAIIPSPSSSSASTELASAAFNGNVELPATTAFDNPMFNSGIAASSAGSEATNKEGQQESIETIGSDLGDELADVDCEKLVEISLDSTETINSQ